MRVRSVLAVGAVLALLLSGCSRGQEANQTLPTASSSASAEATLEPLGPPDLPMPAEAREQTPAGAEAFLRYYLSLINRTSQVMDATFIRSLSSGCETCDRIAGDTESDAALGYSYVGGELAITSIAEPQLSPPNASISFLADQAALSVVDASGAPVAELQFSALPSLSSGVQLTWSSAETSWSVEAMTLG